MSLFRPTSDPSRRDGRDESAPSTTLREAIMDSVSSVRDSLPEQHHEHFETLRQEIIDFAKAHDIPRESLAKSDALREAAKKLSTPDLQRLANLLERFEYLLVHKELMREKLPKYLQEIERLYHLEKQYISQVNLLEQLGILENRAILGIDGKRYPIPTLEQIATSLFERWELSTKREQGFVKLLLVPFGMSLDSLCETLKQFLLDYKKNNPTFDLDINRPLWTRTGYKGADIGDSPKLVYYPQFFTREGHQGKTKAQILKEQEESLVLGIRWTLPPTAGSATGGTASAGVAGSERDLEKEKGRTFPGWTIHLLQPSDPTDSHSLGFALIPREGQGTPQGDLTPRPPFRERGDRPPLETNKTPMEYLSLLQFSQEDENSPYHNESGLTPENWIMAFMTHLSETGKLLDDVWNPANTESYCYLTGAFFPFSTFVSGACWNRGDRKVDLDGSRSRAQNGSIGVRTSVMI